MAILDDQQGDKHRKSLTLEGEINTTVTPLGKKLFHTWLLRPLVDIGRINARLDAVGVLAAAENTAARKGVKRELKHVNNALTFCQKIKSGRASWTDWEGLVKVSERLF